MLRNCCEDAAAKQEEENTLTNADDVYACGGVKEYPQVQSKGISESEADDENSDEAESLLSCSQGSCCGNLGDAETARTPGGDRRRCIRCPR